MGDSPRHLNSYGEHDHELAYQVYRGEAGRSIRKTANLTGIPAGTLMSWSRVDGWQLRLRDDDDRDVQIMRRHADMTLIGKQDELIERAYDLATTSEDDRVKADMTKFLLGVLGYSPQVAAAKAMQPKARHEASPDAVTGKSAAELAAFLHGRILGAGDAD